MDWRKCMLLIGGTLTGALAVSALAEKPKPANPFEAFGNEPAVRGLIERGYRTVLNEKMSAEDLQLALEELPQEFETLALSAGSQRAEALKERRRVGELQRGLVVLQLRTGAVGGNPCRIFMHGRKSNHVDEVTASPLNLEGEINTSEAARAYFQGGYIPRGKVFIIKWAEYWGTAQGDSNGHGEFKLVLGDKEIEGVRDQEKVARTTWKGTLAVKAGDEAKVYLEVANSSRGMVRIKGYLVEEQQAKPGAISPLKEDQKQAVARWVLALNADTAAERDRAQDQLLALGPAVADLLKAKTDLPARAKVRVADLLEHFGE